MPPLTNSLKRQLFASIVVILYTSYAYNKNCSIDLYNRDVQTTITLFTRNMSSHKTERILSELPLLALSYFLYRVVSCLMNKLEEECFCLREISKNLNKLLLVFVYPLFLYCTLVFEQQILFFVNFILLLFKSNFLKLEKSNKLSRF